MEKILLGFINLQRKKNYFGHYYFTSGRPSVSKPSTRCSDDMVKGRGNATEADGAGPVCFAILGERLRYDDDNYLNRNT